jgi:hypothetical protein
VNRGFWWRNLKERDSLKNLGVYVRIIFKNLKEIEWKAERN